MAGNRPHKTSHILLVSDNSGRGLPQSKTHARCVAAGNSRSVLDCASPLALYHRTARIRTSAKIPPSSDFGATSWQTRLRFTSARQEQSANITSPICCSGVVPAPSSVTDRRYKTPPPLNPPSPVWKKICARQSSRRRREESLTILQFESRHSYGK